MPPLPDAAWTPYPAYEWRENCRPDKRSASGSLALVITPSPSVADITT
ncbi:hypothetical protein HMPREF1620_03438 [Escherichia coli 909945-2]|nr:hypothetical protein HMPREF1620_03438 [Escherichia coli 909945-2]